MNTTTLINFMDTSRQKRHRQSQGRMRKTRLSFERENSKNKYIDFTNLSKTQQIQHVKKDIRSRRSDWQYEFYRTRNSFSVIEQQRMQEFPHNNDKYNVQFLERSYLGDGLKHTSKGLDYFPKTSREVYSKHYQPILKQKIKYNENYQIRPSLFGDIQLDSKRQRIMNMYKVQANPFSTQKSNGLISRLRITK